MPNDAYKLWFHDLSLKPEEKICILESGIVPEDFFNMCLKEYIKCGFDLLKAELIENSKNIKKYMDMSEYLLGERIKLLLYNDEEFPWGLKNIPNPPSGLFVKGTVPDASVSIGIVGARRASDYGKTAAYKFSIELARRGIAVISGMARGIDSCAHRGALDANGKTCAVMGSGFKNIYPSQNLSLAEEIAKSGCIVTEYMPDMPPLAYNFPERNRIISGLSRFVLIVEAGERSVSLITARLAAEQGRDVFAVPGNIYSPNSSGTNKLIQDGAKAITDIKDILEEFGFDFKEDTKMDLDEREKLIIGLIKNGGTTIDNILQNSTLDAQSVLTVLSRLECSGIIKRGYGGYYISC